MQGTPGKELSLFDSTCLIVGIMVGVGIFQTTPDIARGAGSAWGVFGIWLLGGLISLCGALCVAELATAFPREGGAYVYLGRAYGPFAGFLYGWFEIFVMLPSGVALMALVFATYAEPLCSLWGPSNPLFRRPLLAALPVLVLTLMNVLGVREGKWTQNVLTSLKILGLLLIATLAATRPAAPSHTSSVDPLPAGIALILVLYTYTGWAHITFVAGEVTNPRRNITRALLVGVSGVLALYLVVNGAFLHVLGYAGLASSRAAAADAMSAVWPGTGVTVISLLICLSALGVTNGLILSGARMSYALGVDHRRFRVIGRWSPRTGTPVPALLLQAGLAAGMILILGSFIDVILYTAVLGFAFFLATVLAVAVLRRREPDLDCPFRMPAYPVPVLVMVAVCVYVMYTGVVRRPEATAVSLAVVALGLPVYWLGTRGRTS